MDRDTLQMFRFMCSTILLIVGLGEFSWEETAPGAGNHTKEFPSDFDRLKTILQQPHSRSAAAPEWLDFGVDHRTRYEMFNQSYTKGTAGSDQMVV